MRLNLSRTRVILVISFFSLIFGLIIVRIPSVEPYPAWVEITLEKDDVELMILSEDDLLAYPSIWSIIQTYKYKESIQNISRSASSPVPLIKLTHEEGLNLLSLFGEKYIRSIQFYSFAFTLHNSSYSIKIWFLENPPTRM